MTRLLAAAAPGTETVGGTSPGGVKKAGGTLETASGCPRDFLENRFVYVVISPRARGLSVGVNMNPDRRCNFDCVYCEVNRQAPVRETALDTGVMAQELQATLQMVHAGGLHARTAYCTLPEELLKLRHVALSGDGEPTLSPQFGEAVEAVVHLRALGHFPFFKLVLITNGTGLHQEGVRQGLAQFTRNDEIWIKLDGGTTEYINKVNRPQEPCLDRLMNNILELGRQRPVVIQSLFPQVNREEPSPREIGEFAQRLLELKNGGAQISLVQIYSATRPTPHSECGHLSLRSLSRIAQFVRERTALNVEVF